MLHSALLVLFCTIAFICITIETDDVEPAAVKKCMCYVRYQQLFCQYAKELYFGHLISSADNCSQVHELRVNMHPKIHILAANRLSLMNNLRLLSLRAVGLQKPLEPDIFHGLIRLRELYLDGPHDLKTLRAHTFQYTPRLSKLGLSRCGLQTMESGAFCELDELIHLDLSYNRLLTFSCGWLSGLTRLRNLNLWDVVGKQEDWTHGRGNVVPTCFFCPVQRLRYLQLSRISSFENDAISSDILSNYDIYGVAVKIFDLQLQPTNKSLSQEIPTYKVFNFRQEFCNMSCEKVYSCSWLCQKLIVYEAWVYENPIKSLDLSTQSVSFDSTTLATSREIELQTIGSVKMTVSSLQTIRVKNATIAANRTAVVDTSANVKTTQEVVMATSNILNSTTFIINEKSGILIPDETNSKNSEYNPLSNLFIVIIIVSVALVVLLIFIIPVWWAIKNRTRRYSVKDYHVEPANL